MCGSHQRSSHLNLVVDRKDNMKDMAKFAGRQQLQPSDIAETMLKMVESKEYDGGTCVLKTPYEEKIQEDGYTKQVEKMKEYDPVSIVIQSEHRKPKVR